MTTSIDISVSSLKTDETLRGLCNFQRQSPQFSSAIGLNRFWDIVISEWRLAKIVFTLVSAFLRFLFLYNVLASLRCCLGQVRDANNE